MTHPPRRALPSLPAPTIESLSWATPELWLGDACEMLWALPKGCMDLALLDPPYGTTQAGWDIPLDLGELRAAIEHALAPEGVVVMFSQGMFTARLMVEWEFQIGKRGKPIQQPFWRYNYVWDKQAVTNFLNSSHQPLRVNEDICVFYRAGGHRSFRPQYTYGHKPLNPRTSSRQTRRRAEVYGHFEDVPVDPETSTRRCPTTLLRYPRVKFPVFEVQKPTELLEYLVRSYTDEGDLVVDPVMGSGSTLLAAARLGRPCVGGDLYFEQFALADLRLALEAGIEADLSHEVVMDREARFNRIANMDSYLRSIGRRPSEAPLVAA